MNDDKFNPKDAWRYERKEIQFRQALVSTLNCYSVKTNMSDFLSFADKYYYGYPSFSLINDVDITKTVQADLDYIKSKSPDWKAALKNKITEYNKCLQENIYIQDGYIAYQNAESIYITYQLDRDKNGYTTDRDKFIPVFEYFKGAEIAIFLPRLEKELAQLERTAELEIATNMNTQVQPIESISNFADNDKAQWMGKIPTLAYLFSRLKEERLINQHTEIGKFISMTFLDGKYKSISNKTINDYLSRQKNTGVNPNKMENIDQIIVEIKKIHSELEK